VLAPLNWGNPSLSDHNAVNSGAGGAGFSVDLVEVVQQTHYVTAISTSAVYQDILKIHARVLATLGIETHRSRGFNLFSPTIFP